MSTGIHASRTLTKEQLCLLEPAAESCGIVIFGASGDLAHRKLLPALFYLFTQNLLPKSFFILGIARTQMTDAAFRAKIKASLPSGEFDDRIDPFLERCGYMAGEYGDDGLFQKLSTSISELNKKWNVGPRTIFYLSTPPSVYGDIVTRLGKAKLVQPSKESEKAWSRVIVEKPFGYSLKSAQELNRIIQTVLREDQIYRIDHYLAKETVQNILMFRFANILFEPVWNRNYIDHVQILAAEQAGVEHRAGYYEQAGVLRDMFQNHLLQLMALIAMEPPCSLEANAVRGRRTDVLNSVRPLSMLDVKTHAVAAQYAEGEIDGKKVPAYRQEKGVAPASQIATYAALKLELDNWRWQGVPFFLRAGKRLADRSVVISVHFKRVPTSIFKPLLADQLAPNVLRFRIQPDEGISISFEAKHPGPKLCMSTVTMDFEYQEAFKTPPPESYARLFQDAMIGDQTLFTPTDAVEQSWRIMDPITTYWESPEIKIPTYASGSWGPSEADDLIMKNGLTWDLTH